MNLPLTITWTAGLSLIMIGLCLTNPVPWLVPGVLLVVTACVMLFRELARLARRTRRHVTLADLGLSQDRRRPLS